MMIPEKSKYATLRLTIGNPSFNVGKRIFANGIRKQKAIVVYRPFLPHPKDTITLRMIRLRKKTKKPITDHHDDRQNLNRPCPKSIKDRHQS